MSPAPDLSIVIVHYRTPELVAPCVGALRRDLEGAGLRAEWWLVDNGSESRDRASFDALGLAVLDPGANLGYAGGVNLGLRQATADRYVILNPDVLVRPGCLADLLEALEGGFSAAGPRFVWDEGGRLLLPPNEPRRRRWELRASLALTDPRWALRARRAWRGHAQRHWRASEPLASYELSGALLVLRRDAWEEIGPFDEGYPLYFEETDWLHRLRRHGRRAAYIPSAEALHLYDQSARREPRAATWFEASRRRFQRRHYGAWFSRLLEWVEGRAKLPEAAREAGLPARGAAGPAAPALELPAVAPLWLEVSPRRTGFPAAAQLLEAAGGVWQLPPEVWDRLGSGTYWLRGVDGSGRELFCERFTRG